MLIQPFLDVETQLKLTLVRTLFVNRVWLSIQELQQECHKSRNTIIKYCEILKTEAKNMNRGNLIHYEKGRGYFFNGTKEEYQELVISIIHKSLSFDLLQQLLLKDKVSLQAFSDEHYTDPMTVRRILKKFNQQAKGVGLSFYIANGFIQITGLELTIRYFAYTFFWYIYKGSVWPFQKYSEQTIHTFIERSFSKYANINDVIIHQWCYIFTINIIRNSLGGSVSLDMLPDFSEELIHDTFLSSNQFEGDLFIEEIQQIYKLPNDEIVYFLLLILLGARIYTVKNLYSQSLNFHQKHGTIINEKIKTILSYFPEFETTSKENQKLVNSLLMGSLINFLLFPTYILPITGYDYQEYLDQNYPFLKEEMLKRLAQMQKKDEFFISSEDFLLLHLAEMYSILGNPVDFDPTIILQLETDLPITLENLMKKRLLSLFGPFFHLSIVTSSGNKKTVSPDLIVSSTKPKNQTKHDVPIIYVNPKFNNSDLKDLTDAFKQLINQQRQN